MNESDILLRLPQEVREDLKDPLGPIHAHIDEPLAATDGLLLAIGDVVSYHCERAGRSPDVAVIDGRTKRSAVEPEIENTLASTEHARVHADNPAGTITRALVAALQDAISREAPVQLVVEGEEDLATLPAILAAPDGASVLYGQPGEGVVHVVVNDAARERVRTLLDVMEGEPAALVEALRN